jgi:hypothetical protein
LEHRPPITPPVVLAFAHIKVRRESPPPAVETLRLLDALRLDLSAIVIDDDEVQTRCFQEARKLVYPRISRGRFRLGYNVVGHAGARREFALADVGDRACGTDVSIGWKVGHELSVAYRVGFVATPSGQLEISDRRCGQSEDHFRGRFALLLYGGRAKRPREEFPSWRNTLPSRLLGLVHREVAAGEVELGFGLADAFFDY